MLVLLLFQQLNAAELTLQDYLAASNHGIGEFMSDDFKTESYWKPRKCSRQVKNGDFVRFQYSAFLNDGTWVEDSYSRNEPMQSYIGTGLLLKGLDQGLVGMCSREKRLIRIPSGLAYGTKGSDTVPPNSTVIYNVDLIDVWSTDDDVTVLSAKQKSTCQSPISLGDFVRYDVNISMPNGQVLDRVRSATNFIGRGEMIKGLDQSLVGMCEGDSRSIAVPPHLGFGDQGLKDKVPAKTTIIFSIKIIER